MITLNHLKGRKVGVFGLGKAGDATVAALRAGGAEVYAWDDNVVTSDEVTSDKNKRHSSLVTCHFDKWPWKQLACLVLSPGVPFTHPKPHAVVERANKEMCPVIGDIELLYQACPEATYIGITGTNGKSTTTTLIAHVLTAVGKQVEVGGNLGTAALSLQALGKGGIYVLELSSYQLDLVHSTRFNVACLLNLTPDHLDRHGDMEGYLQAKLRIFHRQRLTDTAVIAVDDDYTREVVESGECDAHIIPVSVQQVLDDGIYVENGVLHDNGAAYDLTGIATLKGRHNWQNAAVAYAACCAVGVTGEIVYAAMKSFPGLAHRMEQIAVIDGIPFINDSKATNADATANALAAYNPIYWIAGGKAKTGGIESLRDFFPRIAHAFLIGEAMEDFSRTLDDTRMPYTRSRTLENAVNEAAKMAFDKRQSGAVVLLSPACASFDQFKNFEVRGDAFRAIVQNMAECQEER